MLNIVMQDTPPTKLGLIGFQKVGVYCSQGCSIDFLNLLVYIYFFPVEHNYV